MGRPTRILVSITYHDPFLRQTERQDYEGHPDLIIREVEAHLRSNPATEAHADCHGAKLLQAGARWFTEMQDYDGRVSRVCHYHNRNKALVYFLTTLRGALISRVYRD